MKRWWMVIGLTTGCTCGGAANPGPAYVHKPAVDCTAHDTALRELKPWESTDRLVSPVDVGFAVKKMASLEPTMALSTGLSADDFGVPAITMTLNPRGAEEVLRSLPTDDSEAAKSLREHCEDGSYMRLTGEVTVALPWQGRTLTGTAPMAVEAWGPLPTEMSLSTRVHDWQKGSAMPRDWRALLCAAAGEGATCRLGPSFVEVTGPLSEPRLQVVTSAGGRATLPLSILWATGKE